MSEFTSEELGKFCAAVSVWAAAHPDKVIFRKGHHQLDSDSGMSVRTKVSGVESSCYLLYVYRGDVQVFEKQSQDVDHPIGALAVQMQSSYSRQVRTERLEIEKGAHHWMRKFTQRVQQHGTSVGDECQAVSDLRKAIVQFSDLLIDISSNSLIVATVDHKEAKDALCLLLHAAADGESEHMWPDDTFHAQKLNIWGVMCGGDQQQSIGICCRLISAAYIAFVVALEAPDEEQEEVKAFLIDLYGPPV